VNRSGLLAELPPPPAGRDGWPWTEEVNPDRYSSSVSWPPLTIVTPSYNQGEFLEETIRSVLLQNYPRLHYRIIDGASQDGSVEILERYRPWLETCTTEPDTGQANALNKGFRDGIEAGYHGWINSDDFYLPGTFQRVAEAAAGNPLFIYGDYYETREGSSEQKLHRVPAGFAFEVRCGGIHLPSHATLWRADRHLAFNESLEFIMDADLFKRIARGGGTMTKISEPLATFRRHPASKTEQILPVAEQETRDWLGKAPAMDKLWWRLHLVLRHMRRARKKFGGDTRTR